MPRSAMMESDSVMSRAAMSGARPRSGPRRTRLRPERRIERLRTPNALLSRSVPPEVASSRPGGPCPTWPRRGQTPGCPAGPCPGSDPGQVRGGRRRWLRAAPADTAAGFEGGAARADDERHRHEDGAARDEHLHRDLLAEERPAEDYGDDRIHVGVRGDERGRGGAQEPDVGAEADQGPRDYEVADRQERVRGEARVAELSARRRDARQENAPAQRRQAGRDERPLRERRATRVERPGGPGERASHRDHGSHPVDRALAERVEEKREPGEPGDEAEVRGQVQPLAEDDPVEERHPERDAPDEERRHARGNSLLGPREAAVADQEEGAAEDERRPDLAPADAVAFAVPTRKGPREQDRARREVADPHREERRQVSDGDRHRHEGRAPDDVDRPQGEPDPASQARHPGRMPAAGRSAQVELTLESITYAH